MTCARNPDKLRLEMKKNLIFAPKTCKISIDFFCEFRIKVPSKNQLLRSGSVCGSELSQCWACAERGEKRSVICEPAWEKETNKKMWFFNWVLPKEISPQLKWKTKIIWNAEVQPQQVSWNSWATNNTFLLENQNVARSIWLSNLKKMRALWCVQIC